MSKLPKHTDGWKISSINTDGVAVVVVMKRLLQNRPKDAMNAKEPYANDVHMIADDPGRANLSYTAQKTPRSDEWVAGRLTRETYRRRSLFVASEEYEKQHRAQNPRLQEAIAAMSLGTWKTTDPVRFFDMIERCHAGRQVLIAEYVTSPIHAVWRMRTWRRKRETLMQYCAGTIREMQDSPRWTRGRREVVYGLGAGGFAPTGPGEQPVPTKQKNRELVRVARCLQSKKLRVRIESLVEDRTSKCCHGCHNVLDDILDENGYVIRDMKQCNHCKTEGSDELKRCSHDGTQHAFKRRNRDWNAAKNLWEVLKAIVLGQDRPEYLVRRVAAAHKKTAVAKRTRNTPKKSTTDSSGASTSQTTLSSITDHTC